MLLATVVGGCVNPHLNGGEIPWGSDATSWRKLYEWLSVPQGASLVSSGLLLDPQTAISIQGRQELATHSSLLLAQIQKYTIPQNALRHLYAGFRRHLQLYIFCDEHLLCARLRKADQVGAAGTVDELTRIIERIRLSWPKTRIIIRGDGGFCREDLMAWCEDT